jgi:hypothetical protein
MNKIGFIFFILLFGGISKLSAQENSKKSLFVISPGYAIFNNGDQAGISFSNEYIRNTSKYLTYGVRYMFAHGEGNVEGFPPEYDVHISTTALDLNGFFRPFKSNKHILLLGLGISIDYTRTSYLSNTDYIISNNKIYTIANTDATITLIEPVISLHYYYNFTKNLFLGINMNARDLKLYQYIIGIGGGVKF